MTRKTVPIYLTSPSCSFYENELKGIMCGIYTSKTLLEWFLWCKISPEHSAVSSVGKWRCGIWRTNRLEYYKIQNTQKKPVSLYPSAEEEQTYQLRTWLMEFKKGKKDTCWRAQGSKWNCRKMFVLAWHWTRPLKIIQMQVKLLGHLNVNNT